MRRSSSSAFAILPPSLATGRTPASAGRPSAIPAAELPRWPPAIRVRGGSSPQTTPSLDAAQLASSLSTVLLTALLLRALGLRAQSSKVLKAAGRMSGQLFVMGLFVLTPLFAFASSSPWKIALWVSFVAVVASREAASRSKYSYDGQVGDCLLALLGGVGLTLLHLVTCVLHRPSKLEFSAHTIIPISGMLFGNALSAATLGMSSLLSSFLERREGLELRMSRGASVREAALPAVGEAVEAALMPTVNAMAATGLIFMPGMMTGQILGGQSPGAAAAYQIMIYFAIAASSCMTAMLLSCILTARMFDLRRQALVPWRSIPGLRTSQKPWKANTSRADEQISDSTPESVTLRFIGKSRSADEHSVPILRVQGLTVDSTNLHVPSLEVYAGDRIGVRGRSGIGKTQLLRALARLDPISSNVRNDTANRYNMMSLDGQSWEEIPPANWRNRITWVSQDRPTISGTPRAFYEQLSKYQSRRLQKEDHECSNHLTPMEIAREWNLPDKAWDQPWADVSGGEAQRLSLAIALSIRPTVLLLDEPTASCDADTTERIERSLIENEATVLLVSHSEEQVNRFCSSTIELVYD